MRAPVVDLLGSGSLVLLAALLLFVVALFTPQLKLAHDTYDYIVIFDITQSMDVEDYEVGGVPVSRLGYARSAVREVLRDLPCGSRVGWGAFAEYRSLLLLSPVEVCANYNDLIASLDKIDGRMRWANASEVGRGVYWSVRVALNTESKPDVVFISDGQEAPPLDPAAPVSMPDDVQPGQVRGWVVGAGSETPSPIPKTDEDDRRVGYWQAHDVVQLVSPRWHAGYQRRAAFGAARAAFAGFGATGGLWLHAALHSGLDPGCHAGPPIHPPVACADAALLDSLVGGADAAHCLVSPGPVAFSAPAVVASDPWLLSSTSTSPSQPAPPRGFSCFRFSFCAPRRTKHTRYQSAQTRLETRTAPRQCRGSCVFCV
ncbi:MAG: hypothetical protein WDO56_13985 [Gammaproteobacteria bacterium]